MDIFFKPHEDSASVSPIFASIFITDTNKIHESLTCLQCGQIFTKRYKLEQHASSHYSSDEHPYRCSICGERFNTIVALTIHRRKHDQHTCNICNKIFTRKFDVRRHKRVVHEGINSRIKCTLCSNIYFSSVGFKLHMATVHEGQRHLCDVCGAALKSTRGLAKHMLIHREGKPYRCNQHTSTRLQPPFFCYACPKVFEDRQKYRKHTYIHKERNVQCTSCPRTFLNSSELMKHVRNVHEKRRNFSCTMCNYSAAANCTLEKHIAAKHTRDFPLKCDCCDMGFFNPAKLETHRQLRHGGLSLICEFCPKTFKDRTYFNLHVKKHDPNFMREKHQCPECHKVFDYKSQVRTHVIKKHSGEGKQVCEVCGRSFSNYGMAKHMRTHDGVKRYICDQCGKGFTEKPGLLLHLRVHTKEKPYKCTFCGNCFTQKGSLNIHLRLHTGERPHKCEICGREFVSKSAMKSHRCKGAD